jgi:hypothetical protein
MAYQSPHHAREFLFAACLAIVHDYALRCQRRPSAERKQLLERTREIDLCARLADFFGPVAHLAAQGTDDIDLTVRGPTIRCEVKYFRPPAARWVDLQKDWDWLLGVSSANDEFRKRAWVVFWPSAASGMYRFTNCLSVSKGAGGDSFCLQDYAPFSPYAEPVLPKSSRNQRLRFKEPSRLSIIKMPGGKRVRVDIVGQHTSPLWCAICTRTVDSDDPEESACTPIEISDELVKASPVAT